MISYLKAIRYLVAIVAGTANVALGFGNADVEVSFFGGDTLLFQATTDADPETSSPPTAAFDSSFVLQPNIIYRLYVRGQAIVYPNWSAGYRSEIDLLASLGADALLSGSGSVLTVIAAQASGSGPPPDSKSELFPTIPFSKTLVAQSSALTSRSSSTGHYSVTSVGQLMTFSGILTVDTMGDQNANHTGTGVFESDLYFSVSQPTQFSLTGNISAAGRGTTQGFPRLPNIGTGGFTNAPSGDWVDPPLASGFDFAMTGPSLFTEILAFPSGIDADDQFEVWTGNTSLGVFSVGQTVSFGAGVPSFRVTGISPSVDGTSPTAFPIRLAFDTTTASFTMTPRYDPGQAYLSNVVIVPATTVQPPRFSGLVMAVPPSGLVRLQASTDLGINDPWADIASAPLDGSGSNTFTDIVDNRPQAIGAKNMFFRAVTESTSEP